MQFSVLEFAGLKKHASVLLTAKGGRSRPFRLNASFFLHAPLYKVKLAHANLNLKEIVICFVLANVENLKKKYKRGYCV